MATFSLAGALRAVGVQFQLAKPDQGDTAAEAVASAEGFTLRLNGSERRRFGSAADVARALAEARQ
jgi:hypothetical protein